MGRVFSKILLLALFAASTAMLASAQIEIPKLNLPFEFQVTDQHFPSGTYDVKQENPNTKLYIRSKKIDGAFITVNLPPRRPVEEDKTWLVFNKYGEKFFLSQIWSHRIGVQFMEGESEKQLRESGVEAARVNVNVKVR